MCKTYMTGGICMDSACPFAHGWRELRATNSFRKTAMCRYFLAGNCHSGANCRHAHHPCELRPVSKVEFQRTNHGKAQFQPRYTGELAPYLNNNAALDLSHTDEARIDDFQQAPLVETELLRPPLPPGPVRPSNSQASSAAQGSQQTARVQMPVPFGKMPASNVPQPVFQAPEASQSARMFCTPGRSQFSGVFESVPSVDSLPKVAEDGHSNYGHTPMHSQPATLDSLPEVTVQSHVSEFSGGQQSRQGGLIGQVAAGRISAPASVDMHTSIQSVTSVVRHPPVYRRQDDGVRSQPVAVAGRQVQLSPQASTTLPHHVVWVDTMASLPVMVDTMTQDSILQTSPATVSRVGTLESLPEYSTPCGVHYVLHSDSSGVSGVQTTNTLDSISSNPGPLNTSSSDVFGSMCDRDASGARSDLQSSGSATLRCAPSVGVPCSIRKFQ